MATSGSINSSAYSDRYLTLNWSIASQDVARNLTYINWELRGSGGSATKWYKSGNFKVVIDGEQVYYSADRIQLYNGTVVASGQKMMAHHTNGVKSFSASIEAGIYVVAVNVSGSGSWDLPNIPKSTTIHSFNGTNLEGTFSATYSTSSSGVTNKIRISIPQVKELEKFDYSSGAGFKLSTATLNYLYSYMKNSKTVKIGAAIETWSGGTKIGESIELINVCSLTNANPTLSPTIEDTDAKTLALTGDKNKLVRYYSNAYVKANPAAVKGASITYTAVSGGGKNIYTSTGNLTDIVNGTFVFSTTDSRGYTTTKTIEKTLVEYVKLTCNIESKVRLGNDSKTTTEVKILGNYFNASFGAVNNTLALKYRYKINEGAYSNWITVTPELSGDTYETILTFDNTTYKDYLTFQCIATDKLATVTTPEIIAKATPVFDWNGDDFAFNVPVYIQDNPIADFVIEQEIGEDWSYQKWNSGIVECWGTTEATSLSITNPYGNLYYTSHSLSLPGVFSEVPTYVECATISAGGLLHTCITEVTKTTLSMFIDSNVNTSFGGVKFSVKAKGRWK